MSSFFSSPVRVFLLATVLHAAFLVYGVFQDTYSPLKYTDIDYFVFTDAARFVAWGQSPYRRDTYRYTPLLAWMLYPTAWGGLWFSFGKVLFSLGDVLAGWFIYAILRSHLKMPTERALKFTSIWLLNPMVIQISTRGSSEGLLGVLVTALLWAVLKRRILVAGALLGFAVHFKIYPFIYASSIVWWLDAERLSGKKSSVTLSLPQKVAGFVNGARLKLAIYSLVTFSGLNLAMYYLYVTKKEFMHVDWASADGNSYGMPFLQHSFFHHFTRIDHRHNFSAYNTLLHVNSSPASKSSLHLESLAFVPQLGLSAVLIPIALAKKDLPTCMLAQTFAFVTFNKVCTSQYFLWYMVFLPFSLPSSSMLRQPTLGITAIVLWVVGQGLWLQQGYQLEFLGNSTFVPGLWLSSLIFFAINTWILGITISDVGNLKEESKPSKNRVG